LVILLLLGSIDAMSEPAVNAPGPVEEVIVIGKRSAVLQVPAMQTVAHSDETTRKADG
jgi:hypothetical protein